MDPISARFLIVGASGPVGRRLRGALAGQGAIATYHARPVAGGTYFDALSMRISDLVAGHSGITHAFLLHGITAIDACARDPIGTRRLNVQATCRIIDELRDCGIVPVFLSSDAVFDGARGLYAEDDAPSPTLTYGRQKLEVENHLASGKGPWLIARLAKIVGTGEPGDVLAEWLSAMEAGQVIRCARDQVMSPVHVDDAVRCLGRLAEGAHNGLFHVAGPDVLTRLELAKMLAEAACDGSCPATIEACSLRDFDFAEPRPLDCSMSARKAVAAGSIFRDMRTACRETVRRPLAETAAASGGMHR